MSSNALVGTAIAALIIGHHSPSLVRGQAVCSELKEPISAIVSETSALDTLIVGLQNAGLANDLSSPYGSSSGEPLVLIAPNNEAFQQLAEGLGADVGQLVTESGVMKTLLNYHIIPAGTCDPSQLSGAYQTVHGESVSFGGNSTVTDSNGNTANIVQVFEAGNGAVVVVDQVLLPQQE
jgi:uncharacterized surface protein with fasciclin (FAS1) repeats